MCQRPAWRPPRVPGGTLDTRWRTTLAGDDRHDAVPAASAPCAMSGTSPCSREPSEPAR
jgi:hypothetical protein